MCRRWHNLLLAGALILSLLLAPMVAQAQLESLLLSAARSQAAKDTGPKDWKMYKGNAGHTGFTGERISFPLKLIWKNTLEGTPDNPASPVVADGVLYVITGGRLYALDASSGTIKWRYPAAAPLDSALRTSPAVGDDLVYFGSASGKLYAVTKDKGQQAWTFAAKGAINSSPVVDAGTVYFGSDDNSLYAIDARTGGFKWGGAFRTQDDISSPPSTGGGNVYFLSNDSNLYAASVADGSIMWTAKIGITRRNDTPLALGSTVYLASVNRIYAYRGLGGSIAWSCELPCDVASIPAAGTDALYFMSTDNQLYTIGLNGERKWNKPFNIGSPVTASPVIVNDTVVIVGKNGLIIAIDAQTGEVKWKNIVAPALPDPAKPETVDFSSSPAVSHGTLFAVADDGSVYAFRGDAGDSSAPQISPVWPKRSGIVPAAPPMDIIATVVDPGAGIKPESIAMTLDGNKVDFDQLPERGIIWYTLPADENAKPLSDGLHTVTVTATDWMGNKAEQKWSFFADSRIQPAKITPSAQGEETGIMPGMEAEMGIRAPAISGRRTRRAPQAAPVPAVPAFP